MIHRSLAAAALAATAMSLAPACSDISSEPLKPAAVDAGRAPGSVGDPCVIPEASDALYLGEQVQEALFIGRYDACLSGLCLVNHVQGLASCPLGQPEPVRCTGPGDSSCGDGASCTAAGDASVFCDATAADHGASVCASGVCDARRSACACSADQDCPSGAACDVASSACMTYVCMPAAGCQSAGASAAENAGKACCVEGGSAPVAGEVCGQCAAGSGRRIDESVYCSCRCGRDLGQPDDGLPLCDCPDDFECSLLMSYVGLGDELIAGKYCIRKGTAYTGPEQCGAAQGFTDSSRCASGASSD